MLKIIFHVVFITLLSLFCYLNTLNGQFVFDDVEAVVKNKDVLASEPVINLLQNDFWGTSILKNHSHKSYRPITVLSFRLNNYLSVDNKPEPYYYHLVNIILYSFLCLLFYFMFKIFYEIIELETCDPKSAAFLTDLLFVVHPIHVECVAAIVGRADLLCANMYVISFICYYKTITIYNKFLQYFYFALTIVFTTIAMFAKETGLTILGFCVIFELLYNRTSIYNLRRQYKHIKTSITNSLLPIIIRTTCLVITGCLLLYLRWWVMDFQTPKFQLMDNPASFHPSLLTRTLSYIYIYSLNLLLLVWPEWLCFDWAMGCIPLIHSISDERIIFIAIFLITSLLFCLKLTKNFSNSDLHIPIALIIVSFLPASNIIRVGFVVAERQLLIPSAGFCMLIAIGFIKIKQFYPKTSWICYALLILVFTLKVQFRNNEWLTEKTLYNSALAVCPENAKVHYNIAKIAADEGDIAKAETEYRIAISLYPKYDHALNNLANILRDLHQYDESEILLKRSLSIRPEFAAAWMNLGIVQMNKKQPKQAEISFMTALHHRSHYADCYYNLGNLYLEEKRNSEALSAWKSAIQIKPLHAVAWSNLLILLDSLGRSEEAIVAGSQAVKLLPKEPAIYFNLANSLGKAQRWRDAEYNFMIAISLNPNNALYYSNLGVLYHRWNKHEEAANYYRIALKLDPSLKSARDNLRKIKS